MKHRGQGKDKIALTPALGLANARLQVQALSHRGRGEGSKEPGPFVPSPLVGALLNNRDRNLVLRTQKD